MIEIFIYHLLLHLIMNNFKDRLKRDLLVVIVLVVVLMFSMEFLQGSVGVNNQNSVQPSQVAGDVANTYPTTIFNEPGYTNGTYKIGEIGNIASININTASTVCDALITDEIYNSLVGTATNGSAINCLASSYSDYTVNSVNNTTFDPLTGAMAHVSVDYIVHLRPNVQWTNIPSSGSKATDTFSNYTSFVATNGKTYSYTYTNFYDPAVGHNVTFNGAGEQKYYLQSQDVILTWKMLFDAVDYSGDYTGVVNIVPINNLTVEFMLSVPTSTFVTSALEVPIMPYNIWVAHDYASSPGLWNYSASSSASSSYNAWNLGYTASTGIAPGLVGTGPFMMNGGYGMPKGAWIPSDYWQLYVNPHYFGQYVPSLDKYTPKIYSIYDKYFASYSPAVAAESSGQIYSIMLPPPPTFLPTLQTIPNTYIYNKPTTGFGYMEINAYKQDAPYNITAFRQALNYAVDKGYIASVVNEGYGVPGESLVPVSDSVWYDKSIPSYSYDLAKANATIATIPGFTWHGGHWDYKGKKVTATIQITVSSEDPLGVEAAEIIASAWGSIGISTTVKQESFTTLVTNLVALSPSDPTTYNVISLGVSGIIGNPTSFFEDTYNASIGVGSGFYMGPFSHLNSTEATTAGNSSLSSLSSTQMTSYMGNLTTSLVTNLSFSKEIKLSDQLQLLGAVEANPINVGYGIDTIPITNSTFTGIIHDTLGVTGFWYWNFMNVHLKKAVVSVKPVALPTLLEVGVISNSKIYMNGQYGNMTIQVRNQYGQALSHIPVSIGYTPSGAILNISSISGTTNSNGIYKFEFKIISQNTLIYTSDYTGSVNFTVSALAPSSSYVAGTGYANIDISPYGVAYKVIKYPNYISVSNTSTEMAIEIYNPATGKPISGYKYTVESLSGLLKLMKSTGQTLHNTTSFSSVYGFGFMSTSTPGTFHYFTHDLADGILYHNGYLYIADMGTNNVTRYNLSTGAMKNVTVGANPMQLAYDSHNNTIFVTNSNNVTVINPGTMAIISTIAVGNAPVGIAYDSHNNTMYVANSGSDTVSIINASAYNVSELITIKGVTTTKTVELVGKVIDTVNVGANPQDVVLGTNNTMYVSNYGSHNVTAIKQMNSTIIQTTANINVYAENPMGMTATSTDLFIANAGSDNITIVNMATNTVVNNLTLQNKTGVSLLNEPMGLAYNKGTLYVTNAATKNVTAINVTAAISNKNSMGITNTYHHTKDFKNIMVGTMPTYIASNTTNTQLFVANYLSGNITEINPATNKTVKSFNVPGLNVTAVLPISDYNMTEISGTTGSNGMIYLNMTANNTFNYAINGITSGFANTYLFMGDYSSGAAMAGAAPYMDLGELTSGLNSNGFGVSQPFEIPVTVNSTSVSGVHISTKVMKSTITYNGTTEIMLTATKDGTPLSDYTITVTAQNALGANRGLVYNTAASGLSSGANPNSYFGSTSMPEYTVTTNANGIAYVNFTAAEYTYNTTTGSNYKMIPFTSTHYVPYDEFQLGITGMNGTGALNYMSQANIVSTPFVFNNTTSPFIFPVAKAYISGASYSNGNYYILSDHPYTMYINSTYNTMAGPSYKDISVTVSTNYGKLSKTSVNTGSTGSYKLIYTSAPVSTVTKVTISIEMKSGSNPTYYNTTYYVEPYHAPSYTLDYVVIGIVAAVAAVFAVLYAMDLRKLKAATKK